MLGAALAPCARAQGALHLTWNDCALGSIQSSNHDFPCDTEQGLEELFCAFRMPQATGADGVCRTPDVLAAAGRLKRDGAYERPESAPGDE